MKKDMWFDIMVDDFVKEVKRLRIMKTGTEIDSESLKDILGKLSGNIEWGRARMLDQAIEETKK